MAQKQWGKGAGLSDRMGRALKLRQTGNRKASSMCNRNRETKQLTNEPCFRLRQQSRRINSELNDLHTRKRVLEERIARFEAEIRAAERKISERSMGAVSDCSPSTVSRNRPRGRGGLLGDAVSGAACAASGGRAAAEVRRLEGEIDKMRFGLAGARRDLPDVKHWIDQKYGVQRQIRQQMERHGCR